MKRILFLITLVASIQPLIAQTLWTKRAGGASTDLANCLWVDGQNNAYVTGSFSGKAKFHKTEISSLGGGDVFVTKYNSDGIPLWVRSFGGKADDFANAITSDPEGNLYITGVYTDTAYFEGEPLFAKGPDVFVLKLSPKGQMVWVKSLETFGTAIPQAIAVTDQGGVYIGGLFSGQFNIKTQRQMGQTDGFVSKLTWDGNYSWTKVFGGPGFDEVNVLRTDAWGRVIAAGVFDQTMVAEDQELAGLSSKSAFVIKLEATGNMLWANNFTGLDAAVLINDVVCDLQGTAFITGKFSNEVQFGSYNLTSKGQSDLFVCAIGTKGQIDWASSLGGSEVEESIAMELSPDGKYLLVAGLFNKLLEYGKKTIPADFENQIFFSRWDLRGNLDLIRKQEFHSHFNCSGHRMDARGQLWICGSFTEKTSFGKTELVSAGEEDIFISRISDTKVAR